MRKSDTAQTFVAELLGTALLLATVVGSGIMGEQLSGGNVAIALLGNTIPTGAILVVLITMLGPISGAHFNPVVTLAMLWKGELSLGDAIGYILMQIAGAVLGVWAAHAMFDLPILQLSQKVRFGAGQWIAEAIATFGLLLTILVTRRTQPASVAVSVGLYITAAYWFTASTSFANPAVTFARSLSNTFAGIRMVDVPVFMVVQVIGALAGMVVAGWLLGEGRKA